MSDIKKIKITKIYEESKQYSVCLGNGTKHVFPSRKQAQHFLNNTNKFLTENLYFLLAAYKQVSQRQIEYWGYLSHQETAYVKQNGHRFLNDCDLAYTRCDYTNGNYFAFIHLLDCCTALKNIVQVLAAKSHDKRMFNDKFSCGFFLQNILTIESSLQAYAQDKATAYFTRPQHSELTKLADEYKPKLKAA